MITAVLQIYTILITIGIHSCERNFYPVSRNVIKSSIAIGEGKSDDYTDVDFHKLFLEEGRKLCDSFPPPSLHKNVRGVQQIRRPWKVKRSSDLEYYYKRPNTPRKRVHARMLEQQENNEGSEEVANYDSKEEAEDSAKTVKRVAIKEPGNREEVEELHGKDEEDEEVEGEESGDEHRSKPSRYKGYPFSSDAKVEGNDETQVVCRHRSDKIQRVGHRRDKGRGRGKCEEVVYKPRKPHVCSDAIRKKPSPIPKYTKAAKSLEDITDEQASNIRRLIQALLIWGLGGLVAMVLFLCCCYAAYLVCIERQVQPSSEISAYSTYESESDK